MLQPTVLTLRPLNAKLSSSKRTAIKLIVNPPCTFDIMVGGKNVTKVVYTHVLLKGWPWIQTKKSFK